ncbi:MAG: hypothetical protein QOJ34_759 [Pseudonocardiales bacterium]|nr:hypothetical protein [Pseudonocardiales bacterium]
MSDRRPDDDFDAIVRSTLDQVRTAVRPDPRLADRLIANTTADRPAVVHLGSRRASRWMLPLLAAAAVVVLAVGAVAGAHLLADSDHRPPTHPRPTPTKPFVPEPSVVPGFHAYAMNFLDEQHGWATGEAECDPAGDLTRAPMCPTLLATSDGGTTWRKLGVPKGLVSPFLHDGSCMDNGEITGPCVDNVLFANEDVGYLWGLHEIYATTDGGRHWSRYVNPTTDWDGASSLVIARNSVIRIAPIGQCSSGCAGTVQWAPLGTTDFTPVTVSTKAVGLYSSILDVRDGTAYLFAGGNADNDSIGILTSPDGGRTWQTLNPAPCGKPADSFFSSYDDFVADDGSLVIGCGTGIRVAAPGASDFPDQRRLPRGRIVWTVAGESAQVLTAADVSAAFNAFGAGANRTTFYRTTDGGLTWQKGATLPVSGTGYSFASGTVGYAARDGGSVLYTTHDGGLTWTPGSFAG